MAQRYRWYQLVAAICTIGCSGCAPSSISGTRDLAVPLTANLISGMTPAEAKGVIGHRSSDWSILERSGTQPSTDQRPPFRHEVIELLSYEHYGHPGQLRLRFFNDRLYEVIFFPSDYAAYLQRLNERGLSDSPGTSSQAGAGRRVRTDTDHQGRQYVAWADTEIAAEIEAWIRRYA
jgi:hypothetical protein